MSTETFQQLIVEGIRGLPPEALAEIADFIHFVRKRIMQPQVYEQELQSVLLGVELKRLNEDEEAHLEREFEGYDKLYPRE